MFVAAPPDAAQTAQSAAPASAQAAAEPSAAEKLFSGLGAVWDNLVSLNPGEVAVNAGLSALVLAAFALAVWVLRKLLHAGLDRFAKGGEPAPESGRPPAAKVTWLLVRLLAAAAALVTVLSIWGLDLVGWLTAGSGVVILRLAVILLLAAGLVEGAGQVIDRLLRTAIRHSAEGRRMAQLHTMRPLIRGVVQGFVVVIASLTALSELGVKIGPLLASAGVLGIALGFGAQTLVKDFITGLFLVMEDIVTLGDNVSIGDKAGTVEAMTLRTIRVRAMDGTLHILPYSEAQVISNRTKTFSAYVFELALPFAADVDLALKVMEEVGAKLCRDPAYAGKILHPLEIFGVDSLGGAAAVLKARFKTQPGQQWLVGREYNRRVKLAFDAAGIVITPPAPPPFPMPGAVEQA